MPSRELQAAIDAAQAAAKVILGFYQKNLTVRTKEDQSPVTEADVKAEETIRAILSERFPGYGFYGEETGKHAEGAESVWLVDPIDGTKSFVRECPYFSTQIALMRGVVWWRVCPTPRLTVSSHGQRKVPAPTSMSVRSA